jgi:L-serine dehydratase
MPVSIFNDVIGPVMRGASSSHCAAALRIGRLARDLMQGEIRRIGIEFDRAGSLPTTHRSQGSDMGLFGGLMGWEADDDRLPDSERWLKKAGVEVAFSYKDLGDSHPNTYHLSLEGNERARALTAVSTGGGMFEVIRIDGMPIAIDGGYDETLVWFDQPCAADERTVCDALGADEVNRIQAGRRTLVQIRGQRPYADDELQRALDGSRPLQVDRLQSVLPVRSRSGLTVPFETCADMLEHAGNGDRPLWELAVDYETARSGLGESEIIEKMSGIVRILRRGVETGLAGTEYPDRVLGVQSTGFRDALRQERLFETGLLNRTILYTTALMEVKSSMGVIVAAPTAGACATLPATCLAAGESLGLDEAGIARGMLAAGLIGVFIAAAWTFAAEEGGCQAEGGAAASMAAAALVDLRGGRLAQSAGAASMALQNMLGLICDPVAGRVEVPCLGKNVMAAGNALSCANMALAGYDAVIPLDETIAAARSVSERMPREHRCTALGGLAATPASAAIARRLTGCAECR